MNQQAKPNKKYQYLIPNEEWKYQFNIHLAPTNNTKERLFTTIHKSPNDLRDKRHKIEYLQKYYSPVIRRYFLDHLNPNRSLNLFFPLFIDFERDNKNEVYHLHLALTELDNKCFFVNKRARLYQQRNNIETVDQLTEKAKIDFLNHIISEMRFREDKCFRIKKLVFNSRRAINIKPKDAKSIKEYLSKHKKQEKYDQDWDLGVDWINSVLIPADLKRG